MILAGRTYSIFPVALPIQVGALIGLVRSLRSFPSIVCECLGVGAVARLASIANLSGSSSSIGWYKISVKTTRVIWPGVVRMVSTSWDIFASGLPARALILRPESAIQAMERLEQMSHHCRCLLNLPNNEAFRCFARDRCIGSLLSQLVDLGYGLTRVGKRVPASFSPWRE